MASNSLQIEKQKRQGYDCPCLGFLMAGKGHITFSEPPPS